MQTTLGRRRLAGVAIAATAALAAWAPTAPAEDAPAPAAKPASCTGPLITDAKDDATNFAPDAPPEFFRTSAPNLDIRETFLTYTTGSDGKKKLTANVVVEKLDDAISGEMYSDNVNWEVLFDRPDGWGYTARALLVDGEFTFEFSHPGDEVTAPTGHSIAPTETAETTGRIHPGPMGVISIDIPTDLIKDFAESTKFETIRAYSEVEHGEQLFYTDRAPDDAESDPTYELTECAAPVAKTETPTELPKEEVKTQTQTQAPAPPAPPAPAAEEPAAAPAPAPLATPIRKPAVRKSAATKAKKCKAKKAKGRKARAKTCKAAKKTKARARKRSR